jgi:hypothetical protein
MYSLKQINYFLQTFHLCNLLYYPLQQNKYLSYNVYLRSYFQPSLIHHQINL